MKKSSDRNARRPTILDIAQLAQASPATVSRVLNDADYPVTEELRERVRSAARQLNYQPNIFSQMLKGVSSREIGIIVPDLINPFYAQLVSAVAKQCVIHGFAPIVCCSYDSPQLEDRQIDILLRQQVAGILLSSINDSDDSLKKLTGPGAPPLILFDQSHEGFTGNSVSFDFLKGGYMAAQYLIQCGHRNIAFMSHPLTRSSRKQIFDGYCRALSEAGIEIKKEMVLIRPAKQNTESDVDFDNGKALAQMLLGCSCLPDAVMAINDITAIGIIDSLSQHGVKVPRDLSVIGFDNIPMSAMISPPLTTIHQPALETGRAAADMLFAHIANPKLNSTQIMIQPELVLRQSVRKNKNAIKGDQIMHTRYEEVELQIFESREEMGRAAAQDAADTIRDILEHKAAVNCIFAAAPSQNEFLDAFVQQKLPWERINAFHMDEYVGLPLGSPQSFNGFLSRSIFDRVPFGSVHLINGAADPQQECARYSELLEKNPPDVVFLGIGENGHIAFNDPAVADFHDAKKIKVVQLDIACRMQQVHDECFASLDLVPKEALTLTVPMLVSAPYLFCIVPGERKAGATAAALTGEISEACPASILRTKKGCRMYIDRDCASKL